jgi:hypothetical protein
LREVRHLDSENWYNDLEIEFKNISSKRIYYVVGYLDFPDVPVAAGGIYGIPLLFGADKNMNYHSIADPDDPYIKPGEPLVFTIAESLRQGLKTEYEKSPDLMRKLELRLNLISFGDGTGFVAERFRDEKIKKAHAKPRKHHGASNTAPADPAEPPQDGCGTCSRYILDSPTGIYCYDVNANKPCNAIRAKPDPSGSAHCALTRPHFFACGGINCWNDEIYESPICPGFTPPASPTPTPEETPTPCVPDVCLDTSADQVDYCAFPPYGCPGDKRPNGSCCYPQCPPSTPPPCNGFLIRPRPGACFWTCIPRSVITNEDDCNTATGYWNFLSNICGNTPQNQVQCDTASWYWKQLRKQSRIRHVRRRAGLE